MKASRSSALAVAGPRSHALPLALAVVVVGLAGCTHAPLKDATAKQSSSGLALRPTAGVLVLISGNAGGLQNLDASLASLRQAVVNAKFGGTQAKSESAPDAVRTVALKWMKRLPLEPLPSDSQALTESLTQGWRTVLAPPTPEDRARTDGLRGYPLITAQLDREPGCSNPAPEVAEQVAQQLARQLCGDSDNTGAPGVVARKLDEGFGKVRIFIVAQQSDHPTSWKGQAPPQLSEVPALAAARELIAELENHSNALCGAESVKAVVIGALPKDEKAQRRAEHRGLSFHPGKGVSIVHIAPEGALTAWAPRGLNTVVEHHVWQDGEPGLVDDRTSNGPLLGAQPWTAFTAWQSLSESFFGMMALRPWQVTGRRLRFFDESSCASLTPEELWWWRLSAGVTQQHLAQELGYQKQASLAGLEYQSYGLPLAFVSAGRASTDAAEKLCSWLLRQSTTVVQPLLPLPHRLSTAGTQRAHMAFSRGERWHLARFFAGVEISKNGWRKKTRAAMPTHVRRLSGLLTGKMDTSHRLKRLHESPDAWHSGSGQSGSAAHQVAALQLMMSALLHDAGLASAARSGGDTGQAGANAGLTHAGATLRDILFWVISSQKSWLQSQSHAENLGPDAACTEGEGPMLPVDYLQRCFLRAQLRGGVDSDFMSWLALFTDAADTDQDRENTRFVHPWSSSMTRRALCLRPGESHDTAENSGGKLSVGENNCFYESRAGQSRWVLNPFKAMPESMLRWWYGPSLTGKGECERRLQIMQGQEEVNPVRESLAGSLFLPSPSGALDCNYPTNLKSITDP